MQTVGSDADEAGQRLRLLGSGPRARFSPEVRLPANQPGKLDHARQGNPYSVRGAVDDRLSGAWVMM